MTKDESVVRWRKTSRSSPNGDNCIETAALNRAVAVRDSKDPDGPQLRVSDRAWQQFAQKLRSN